MSASKIGVNGVVHASWATAGRPASPVAGQVGWNTSLNGLDVYDGSAWRTLDLINGNLALDNLSALILSGGNKSANGVGISFPATQSASSDANTLDDYEEGTWTVTDQSGAGLTFTANTGRYIKIGQMVWASCDFVFPTTANTANAQINLPFQAYNQSGNSGSPGGGNATYVGKGLIVGPIGVYIGNGTTTGFFYKLATNGGRTTNADLSATEIALVFCYPAA